MNPVKKISLSPKLKLGVGRGHMKARLLKITSTIFVMLTLLVSAKSIQLLVASPKNEPSANPQVLGASDTQESKEEVHPYKNYTVKSGETLFSISQRIDVPWTTLAELNKIKPPFSVKTGQVIKIPNNE